MSAFNAASYSLSASASARSESPENCLACSKALSSTWLWLAICLLAQPVAKMEQQVMATKSSLCSIKKIT